MITSYPTRLNGINEWNRVFAADVYFNNFTKQKIFKLGALFSILGKTPTNGS